MNTRLALLPITLLALAGCVTTGAPPEKPAKDPNAKERIQQTEGPIRMSSRYDPKLMQAVNEGRQYRIYTQMSGIGEEADSKLLFPPQVAAKLGITNKQMSRRLMDTLMGTKRFVVFNDDFTVVQDQTQQKWGKDDADLVVDCKVVGTHQELKDISPYRKAITEVKLSVQLVNRLTGESLFDGDVAVTGTWGMVQGEGTMLAPNIPVSSPDVQAQFGNDYERALSKAMDAAVERIDQIVRPVGRLVRANANAITMFGGTRHGFQSGDTVIVFRSITTKLGNTEVVSPEPVAVAKCEGVGTESSLCDLTRLAPGLVARDGDYAILSDASARGIRER